jgi:hypothetical protein
VWQTRLPKQGIKARKMPLLGVALKKGKLIDLRIKNIPRFLINERCSS